MCSLTPISFIVERVWGLVMFARLQISAFVTRSVPLLLFLLIQNSTFVCVDRVQKIVKNATKMATVPSANLLIFCTEMFVFLPKTLNDFAREFQTLFANAAIWVTNPTRSNFATNAALFARNVRLFQTRFPF